MNIGILTHCIANNFGANLQALSTAFYLRNHGYTPIFFYWDVYLRNRSSKMNQEQLEMHRTFLEQYGFVISKSCSTEEDFLSVMDEYNIQNIIVGSDAVFTYSTWIERFSLKKMRLRETTADKSFPNPFWVPFANRSKGCRYFYLSPSCQSTNYKFIGSKTKALMRRQIKLFSYVCARDTCTKEMIEYILKDETSISITPDPVWGFNYNSIPIPSKQEICQRFGLKEKYILMSFYRCPLSSDWIKEFRNIATSDDIAVYCLPMPQGGGIEGIPNIGLPLNSIDWYALIKYSCGYVGHNMHPIIVSMHNNVPFFSIDQHGKKILKFFFEKSSKVYDLMNRFSFHENRVCEKKISNITPGIVYDRLSHFDYNKCKEIAQNMENQYIHLMETICLGFVNNTCIIDKINS